MKRIKNWLKDKLYEEIITEYWNTLFEIWEGEGNIMMVYEDADGKIYKIKIKFIE